MDIELRLTCGNHGHLIWMGAAAELTDEEWAAIQEAIADRGCDQCRQEAE